MKVKCCNYGPAAAATAAAITTTARASVLGCISDAGADGEKGCELTCSKVPPIPRHIARDPQHGCDKYMYVRSH